MGSFAAFLIGEGYLSAAELEEVTQATVLFGGRLGTAVVEAGLMTPNELDGALARHLGLREVPKEWIERPHPAAQAAIPLDLVKRHRVFPLRLEKRTLHVGLLDPRDPSVLDTLAFASGCAIAPYPLSELRFVELMKRSYGVAPSPRFAALLDAGHLARLQRVRAARREARPPAPQAEPPDSPLGPLAPDHELLDEATFVATNALPAPPLSAGLEPILELPQEAALPPAAPPRGPAPAGRAGAAAELRRAEEALANASRRDALIDAALALAGAFAELAALFVVRDGLAAGLAAMRAGEPIEIESILAPLGGEGLLAEAARTGQPLARTPSAALDKVLAKALRCEAGAELAVFPVAIGGRVVNLLVAHSGTAALPATAAAALRVLAQLLGASYERLIRSFKQQPNRAA